MNNISPLMPLISALFLTMTGTSHAQLINGDFQTSDFTGWTVFDTPNGGTAVADVVPFDISGSGTPSLCAQFEVGVAEGSPGGGLGQGAGILQNVTLNAGQLNLDFDIASENPSAGNNGDGGTFELLLNGNVVESYSFGGIGAGQTELSTLSYSGEVTAGTYEVAIEMLRGYDYEGNDANATPFQYIGNVQLEVTAIPEPNTALLFCLGFTVFLWQTSERRIIVSYKRLLA